MNAERSILLPNQNVRHKVGTLDDSSTLERIWRDNSGTSSRWREGEAEDTSAMLDERASTARAQRARRASRAAPRDCQPVDGIEKIDGER